MRQIYRSIQLPMNYQSSNLLFRSTFEKKIHRSLSQLIKLLNVQLLNRSKLENHSYLVYRKVCLKNEYIKLFMGNQVTITQEQGTNIHYYKYSKRKRNAMINMMIFYSVNGSMDLMI
jgi:hypothetical protein